MLSFSKGTNYSILVLNYLFSLPPNAIKTSAELAEILNLPVEFLSKILQKLTHSGIIRSIKGINGGYTLSDNADHLTLKMIVNTIDGPLNFAADFFDSASSCKHDSFSKPVIETMELFESQVNELMNKIYFFKN